MRIADGGLRGASPEETAAAAAQLGDVTAARAAMPDFAAMSKTDLEVWAKAHNGVDLDRRRRKEALIEEVRGFKAPGIRTRNYPQPTPIP